MDELCRLLRSCDLQFFCLEEPSGTEGLAQSDTLELLSCLQQQQNLKVLALNVRHCGPRLGKQGIAWPNMKALYIREGEEDWLDQLPEFEKLQILSLENLGPEIRFIDHSIIENIATCRHLQVLNLHLGEFRDEEELIQIARCCPLLRKFSVRCINFRADPTLGEDLLLGLLPALPHLEFLALGVKFQMPGALLQDISRHCPRLTVLDLPMTQLCISLAVITELHPLWRLESMHFARIYFENPRHLMQRDKLQSVATEWRRIFPKLRGIPCPGDLYSQSMQEDELGEEIQEDSAGLSADEEMSFTEPSLDWDDYDSDWFILRTKLWKVLGYRKDLLIHDKIQYMWQLTWKLRRFAGLSCLWQRFPIRISTPRPPAAPGGSAESFFVLGGEKSKDLSKRPFEVLHAKWNWKSSTAEVNHQLDAHGGSSRNCEKYGSIPDEPLRKDYFPEEPQSYLLTEVLASVICVQHLDGVPVDGYSNLRRIKEVRRS
ncbi:unnamed protein product [Aspergillus oryzae]|nr:unnamed protein product [Aspergillus oryzae]